MKALPCQASGLAGAPTCPCPPPAQAPNPRQEVEGASPVGRHATQVRSGASLPRAGFLLGATGRGQGFEGLFSTLSRSGKKFSLLHMEHRWPGESGLHSLPDPDGKSSEREAVTCLDATIKCGACSPRPVGWAPMGAAPPLWGACHGHVLDGALCPCPATPAASTVPAPHPAPRPPQAFPLHRRPPPST